MYNKDVENDHHVHATVFYCLDAKTKVQKIPGAFAVDEKYQNIHRRICQQAVIEVCILLSFVLS